MIAAGEKAIKEFTEKQFHVTFPLTQKEVVSGENAHPFFKKVRADLGVFATPKWNFYKYLVSPEGRLVGWWSSSLALMADALETPLEEMADALQSLGHEYSDRSAGVELREMAGGWVFMTTLEQNEWVTRMLRGKRKARLSRAALETLAIIAYKQPVTKSEVEAIRGVDSSGTLATLLERSLVTIKGRSTVVGRPLLYGSTPEFLNYFGLRDLNELPRPEELRALVAAREPEQMEMLELDADGMPLALVAAANALAVAEGEAAAADSHIEDEVALLAHAGGDDEDDDDEAELEDDADEFEDDDEEDEVDEDEDEDEDAEEEDEDGAIDDLDDDTEEIEDDEPVLDESGVEQHAMLVSGDATAESDAEDSDDDDELDDDEDDEFEDDDNDDEDDDDADDGDDDDPPTARLSERDGR